jgi:hypothetical protein
MISKIRQYLGCRQTNFLFEDYFQVRVLEKFGGCSGGGEKRAPLLKSKPRPLVGKSNRGGGL